MKSARLVKCKICGTRYAKRSMAHVVCGPQCATAWLRSEKERKLGKEIARRKEALKTRSDWQKETQAAVNAYVRERDREKPCISCGTYTAKQWHAGHFLSRGAHPELALEPRNIFKQCSQCNDHLSGNQLEARKGILAREGQAELDWLEGPHGPKKYSIDDLKTIKAEFKLKLKELLNSRKDAA